ncbi:cryptochrome/photolyase family protein [Sphingomonas prati]|uniref:Deoxyribodipyrimidine photo-lyase n=1 Tax=Sphingomonas prati TaxID=1843237 RepID=A0A7W9BQP9_9SPHN|nr:deoxyribodipyrimidine photo-lyase [Sphingomonas prati]MBB5728392.1 deoxyribodipyrimidine photo-lyase [Sphingomonas prati]GGE74150.1 deoxyribodipyrimidine photo-lyase [Sphingomonas prati]
MTTPSIVWFRQDLRLADQPALAAAAHDGPVVGVYVLDDDAPGAWKIGGAQRWWLHHSLTALAADLKKQGVPLILRRGDAVAEIAKLAKEVGAETVHAVHHYEPWWKTAEDALGKALTLKLHGGMLLDDPDSIRTGSGGRYRMFTAFWKALRERMPPPEPIAAPRNLSGPSGKIASDDLADWKLLPTTPDWSPGFADWKPGEAGAHAALKAFVPKVGAYDIARNLPSEEGTSRLSPHLHHGEVSPAAVWHAVAKGKGDTEPYLREVGWRDFTSNVIDILPGYADANGRNAYDAMPWREGKDADADFKAWTEGRTGYPLVDAGMRQLWTHGWMHNRVRMVAASFMIKHLLLDWRRGEAWYWDCLIDADYGNNSVNWQWVAGTGIDSNPFGRIMAPLTQSPKFEAADYIRTWVPELAGLSDGAIHDPEEAGCRPDDYPEKIIGHREARERALQAVKKVTARDPGAPD